MKCKRPALRYHGGKWRLASWIISNFPEHRIYTEPFGGAASVLIRKPRSYSEVYNDLDGEVVNLFKVLRDSGNDLYARVMATPFSRQEYQESFVECEDNIEQARRTLIRSFMGFGSNTLNRSVKSGFRNNSNRSNTTPAHDWANLPSGLMAIIHRLRGVVIENRDALDIIRQHDSPETLHYCDPPYVASTRKSSATMGYNHEMTDRDHEALAEQLHCVEGMVVLSGYDCDLYAHLYGDWEKHKKQAFADGARKRIECLWVKPVDK